MRAVWRAAGAAVSRRRLQTVVVGLVVLASTAVAVVTLGLIAAVSGPFDKVYDAAHGAHVAAEFSTAKATPARIARTAHAPGVTAAAGPYPVSVLHRATETGGPAQLPGAFTVVGRERPDTAVDAMTVFSGRWATGPGEIVLDLPNGFGGSRLIDHPAHVTAPGGIDLKVVGYATSVSHSADGWVTPAQATALGSTTTQMMYRFRDAGTDKALQADVAAATAGLPPGSLVGTSSYLTIKARLAAGPNTYVPFLTAFGILGLVVSVLIVGTVVSGAVVAGYRHIGILKALGYTPNQVTGVYLLMVACPAAVGGVLGTGLGAVLGNDLAQQAFWGISGGFLVRGHVVVPVWVYPAVLLGMPAVVVASALASAVRARRLPAAVAISAGGVQRTGRGLAAQRRLGGSRLPRPVSLGLGWLFARPGRTALTLSTVVLGVTAATLAIGLATSIVTFGRGDTQQDRVQVTIGVNDPASPWHPRGPAHPDDQLFARLRALPGTAHVMAQAQATTRMAGSADRVRLGVETGDTAALHPDLVRGRWVTGPGQVVASSQFWHLHRLALGQTIVLYDAHGTPVPEKVVGEQTDGSDLTSTDWHRFLALNPTHRATTFSVGLTRGTDARSYAAAVRRVDPGLSPSPNDTTGTIEKAMIGVISALTAMLIAVSALGVFNTVVLTTRERRKDLGILKSLGMTPRQLVALVVTAMAALGTIGGLAGVPAGVLAHRIVVPLTGRGTGRDLPESMLHVWTWPVLVMLVLAGALTAALGAILPSLRASRAPAAEVLRTE